MRILFKQAIKSLFSNKIFAIIMMAIVFVSGATYTLFESTSSSFYNSYNNLVTKGNLHDAIIKQKYHVRGSYKLTNTTPTLDKDGKHWITTIIWQIPPQQPFNDDNDYYNYLIKCFPKHIVQSLSATSKVALYKLIDSAISQQTSIINKNVVSGMSDKFASAVTEIYKDKLTTTNTKSLSIVNQNSAFKVVTSNTIDPANDFIDGVSKTPTEQDDENKVYSASYNNPHNVNKLVMYDGTNEFTYDQTYQQMNNELEYQALSHNIPYILSNINRSKGYRWTIQDPASIGVASVIDPSSYEAILSPSYANANNKISMNPNDFLNLYKNYPQFHSPNDFMRAISNKDAQLINKYKNNLVWIDTTPYFIIGIGTTPDFAYPIVDQSHPTIDVKNQGVVFMNRRGYERIFDAFRTAPNENYISLKFKKGLSIFEQNNIMSQITQMARTGQAPIGIHYKGDIPQMTWPNNVNIVTRYNKQNDSILLAEQRVLFLSKLMLTMRTLSITTTIMLLIFVGLIIILVFSSMIQSKRKILATLLSLGYTRSQIAFSFATVALIIGALPSLFGYLIGHFLQYAFIDMFSNYWTIPIYGQLFSWISLLVIVFAPFIALFALIFIITFLQTRHNVTTMLHGNITKFSWAPAILKYLSWVSIKTRYSFSLLINNFWKLILVSITGVISISAIIIGLSTLGRAEYAYNATSQLSNYTYKIDLYTPTIEGGTYNRIRYTQLHNDLYENGDPNGTPIKATYSGNVPSKAEAKKLNKPHWHIPGIGDEQFVNYDPKSSDPKLLQYVDHYLRYKFQSKPLLDVPISNAINPWNIAEQLMPDNQKNKANNNEIQFMNNPKSTMQNIMPPKTKNNKINPEYIKYFANQMIHKKSDNIFPYTISYQNIITNDTDEEYTYISVNTIANQKHGLQNFHITGYQPNTKFLNIPLQLTNALQKHANDFNVPILINKYIAKEFSLNVGSTIKMNVLNDTNRFDKNNKPREQTFEVEGILNTFDNDGMFTLKSIANAQIGMQKIPQVKDGLSNQYFNGIFTKDKNPIVLNMLPLYSPSGIYIPSDTIIGKWGSVITQIINDSNLWNQNATHIHNVQSFIGKYGPSPLVGSFNTINWKSIDQYTFKNISTLSSYLIMIIQLISIILSIMFAIVVSSLFVDSNKKKIATLWTLGYRKQEITKIFLSTYIVPIVIAIALSIPISFAIVEIMKVIIMNFAHILIAFAITWWMPFIGIGIIATIFSLSIIITIFLMRGSAALDAFKEE